ncbi:HIT family protein [Marinicellulosiphila megalodicopiae]|uniref:HIT family protein n=1 Tax=Marinicellulosiphila megalodicopiae TaxID=2724896 RepID=UPI003BAFFAE7
MFNQEPKNYNCPFCRMIKSGLQTEKDFVFENKTVFVCIALHQHENSGPGLLVIPKQHVENIYDIEDSLLAEISKVTKFIAIKMRELFDIQGITIWQHNEKAGFQDVWHFHTHIKGRLSDDNIYQTKQYEMCEAERSKLAEQLKEYIQNS